VEKKIKSEKKKRVSKYDEKLAVKPGTTFMDIINASAKHAESHRGKKQ